MSNEVDENEGFVEQNQRLHTKRRSVENGMTGDGLVLLEEGDLRSDLIGKDVEDGVERVVQGRTMAQVSPQPQPQQQQLLQGSGNCLERFLHLRSLRVLLVENDDSTRHVVAALLRNCRYEVVEASNGLQAWKNLEDLTNNVDLVLTEVVMPSFSGVALLCKIMSHKTWKNVPVIMMSSHDSMGVVFKCLSKGAVDFLVKPIRKNELKNLWQHVWRRCQISSGSGSESGTQTRKSIKSKNAAKSDYNSGSNDEDDNGSRALNLGDGSDHGSGTQNSWTNQAVDDQVDSPRLVSSSNEVLESPDSTRAQVIYHNAKPSEIKQFPMIATKECQELKEPHDPQPKFVVHVPTGLTSMNQYGAPKLDSSQYSEQLGNTDREFKEKKEPAAARKSSNSVESNDIAIDATVGLPSLEQGLKRHRGSQDTRKAVHDDRKVLRRSSSSAFSRYNAALHSKVSVVDPQSPTPLNNALDKRSEVRPDIQSHSGSNALDRCSNRASVYVDMISTSNNRLIEANVFMNKTAETATTKNMAPSAFRVTKNNMVCTSQQAMLEDNNSTIVKRVVPPAHLIEEFEVQPVNNIQHQHHASNHENALLKKMAEPIPHCGSSTVLGWHVNGNAEIHSVNGSASGSNYGSDGLNGSSSSANPGVVNTGSDNGAGVRSGRGDAIGSESGSGNGRDVGESGDGGGSGSNMDQSKIAQREAALTKFRQRRKERRFKRKVRYQSRKRLAEQQPPYSRAIRSATV